MNYDPVIVTLTIYKPDFTILITETYSGASPNIKKASTGNYYIDLTSNNPPLAPATNPLINKSFSFTSITSIFS